LSKDKSLSCVFEQLVIWDYILVELSLEVQGGQDYFRFVEGTCSLFFCSLHYPLHIDSELTQTLNYFRLWTWGQLSRTFKKKFPKTQFKPPFLWFFSPSNHSLMQTSTSSSPTNLSYTRINIAQEATRRNKQNTSHRTKKIK